MDLTEIHHRLMLAHHEIIEDPRNDVEGLAGAACGPHMKHLAQLAMSAASEGVTADQWRSAILVELGPEGPGLLDRVDTCMHGAGLWPWQ